MDELMHIAMQVAASRRREEGLGVGTWVFRNSEE